MTTTATVVFGEGPQLLGMLTLPEGEARGAGVVICAPFGHEQTRTYRPLRSLAQRIAEGGRPVLRFDWPGSGDSGDATSHEIVDTSTWMIPIDQAVDFMRVRTDGADISLVGLRVGATVGLLAAAVNPAISDVVLLAPFVTGRAYLVSVHLP